MAQNFYVFVSDNPFSSTDLNTIPPQRGGMSRPVNSRPVNSRP
jgi:hypothetical protein